MSDFAEAAGVFLLIYITLHLTICHLIWTYLTLFVFFQILNDSIILFTIHNANEQNSKYTCKIFDLAIGTTNVYVGESFDFALLL